MTARNTFRFGRQLPGTFLLERGLFHPLRGLVGFESPMKSFEKLASGLAMYTCTQPSTDWARYCLTSLFTISYYCRGRWQFNIIIGFLYYEHDFRAYWWYLPFVLEIWLGDNAQLYPSRHLRKKLCLRGWRYNSGCFALPFALGNSDKNFKHATFHFCLKSVAQ